MKECMDQQVDKCQMERNGDSSAPTGVNTKIAQDLDGDNFQIVY